MARETNSTIMPVNRVPTPSHDAAHVLVSFQQNGTSSDFHQSNNTSTSKRRLQAHRPTGRSSRPLSIANVHRPPQNRRRVWRACEPCRKKKTKCDGADPCECCLDAGMECIYEAEGYRRGFIDTQTVEVYGKRIQALEELVASLVKEQHKLAAQISSQRQVEEDTEPRRVLHSVALQPASTFSTAESQLSSPPGPTLDTELISQQDQPAEFNIPCSPVANNPKQRTTEKPGQPTASRVFADDYGILATDDMDGARYVGLGATVTMVGECNGVRNRIRRGLAKKGQISEEFMLNQYLELGNTTNERLAMTNPSMEPLPPVSLMDTLIDAFFLKVYRLFPIIEADDFQRQYFTLLSGNHPRPGFLGLLYAVLAAASPHVSASDPIWAREGCSTYRDINLSEHFHNLALSTSGTGALLRINSSERRNNINTITALTLLGMHLTQLGNLGEAWNTIGQAVRLGYEMGLHRSPKRMGLPLLDVRRRCQLWWCLYVMDRFLSLHVGRPLAINDNDSDVLFPSARPKAPGFVAMTHLCRIIGRIHTTVCSVQHIQKWKEALNHLELQAQVSEFWTDLQHWRSQMIPASEAERTTETYVLISSYCSAVYLLFRPFLPTPHRSLPLESPNPLRECFNAAVECVGISERWMHNAPTCHYYVLHGQNLFTSIMILLHCMRQTGDDETLSTARVNTQKGIDILFTMEPTWPMARQYRVIAEEYQEFTKEVVSAGKQNQCVLNESSHAELALPTDPPESFEPWKEFTASMDLDSTNLFPSIPDAGWMSELFYPSPSSQGAIDPVNLTPSQVAAINHDPSEDPSPKRRKVARRSGNSVCAFSLQRPDEGNPKVRE